MATRSVVVKLVADNGSFDQAMTTSAGKVTQIGTDAKKSSEVASQAFARIKTAALAVVGVAALKSGQDLINLKQSAQVAFTSITGSAAAASAQIEAIYQWDQSVPFPFQNVLAGAQKLAAFGVEMKDVIPTLQAVADATGAVGGNAATLDRIVLAFGQIQAKGKLSAQEMMQLAEAGVPAWQLLADQLGTTVPDAMKQTEKGAIDADTALTALREGIEKKFPGAAQLLKHTTMGTFQSLKAGIRDASKALLDPLQGVAQAAATAGAALARMVGSGIGSTLQGLSSAFSGLSSAMGGIGGAAKQLSPAFSAAGLAMIGTSLASKQLVSGWDTLKIRGMYAVDALRSMGTTVAGIPGKFTSMAGASAAARAALTGLRTAAVSAGRGLMAAFGGPLGIAIIGATTLMSLWGKSQQDAQAKEAAHQAQLQTLKDTLDTVSGAITAATTAKFAKDWVDNGTIEKMKQLGINANLALQAVTEGGPALDAAKDQITQAGLAAFKASDYWKQFGDVIQGNGVSASQELRRLLDDDTEGMIMFGSNADVLAHNTMPDLFNAYKSVTSQAGDLTDASAEQRQAFVLMATAAATAGGVAADKLIPALDAAKESGDSVEVALSGIGVTGAAATRVIKALGTSVASGGENMHFMAGAASEVPPALNAIADGADVAKARLKAASSAMATIVSQAQAFRGAISSAVTSFVDPTGAWQAASDAANVRGPKAKKTALSDEPAVKAAAAALKAGAKVKAATIKAATAEQKASVKTAKAIRDATVDREKADLSATKKLQDNAQARVEATKKEADALKALASERKKDADSASDTLDAATFRLRAAQIATATAKIGLDSATPANKLQWQLTYNDALKDEADARNGVTRSQGDYDQKMAAAKDTTDKSKKATDDLTSAQAGLIVAKGDVAKASEDSAARQKAADDKYQAAQDAASAKLTAVQDAAAARYQALQDAQDKTRDSAQRMASDSADAVSGMVEKVKPSFADWIKQLQDQKTAQDQWAQNLVELSKKLPGDVVSYLAQLGPAGADAVASLNTQSVAELGKAVPLIRAAMPAFTGAITNSILGAIPGSNAALATLGDKALTSLLAELQKGDQPLKDVLAHYGVVMQQAADGSPISFSVVLDPSVMAHQLEMLQKMSSPFSNYGGAYDAGFADGGWIKGGTPGKDSVPIVGMPGEFVVSAQAAKANAKWLEAINNGGDGYAPPPSMQSMPAPAPTAGYSGPKTVIYSTNYYPQAEPESVSNNRSLAVAASLDGN